MNREPMLKQESLLKLKRLYKDILLLTLRQQQIMEAGEPISWPMSTILELQQQRQLIMQRIDELELDLRPASVSQLAAAPAAVKYDTLKTDEAADQELLTQIRRTIQAIQTVERSCQLQMEKAKQTVKSKILQTRDNKKAHKAYNQTGAHASAWFIDKKR